MFYLLLIFSIVALVAGVFAIAFGMVIRDTPFGTALLISGTVALVGGVILVGLAAAVQELRRMVLAVRRMPGGLRPLRPLDRKDGDRKDGVRKDGERRDGERRPPPQRALFPNRAGPDAPFSPPDSIDEPPFDAEVRADAGERADMDARANIGARAEPSGRADQRSPPGQPGPAWLRRAIAEIQSVPRAVEQPAQPPQPPLDPYDEHRYDEPQPARRPLSAEAPPARTKCRRARAHAGRLGPAEGAGCACAGRCWRAAPGGICSRTRSAAAAAGWRAASQHFRHGLDQ